MNLKPAAIELDVGAASKFPLWVKADMCVAKSDVCFTPNSDRESGPLANRHVCFTPESGHVRSKTDIQLLRNSGFTQSVCVFGKILGYERRNTIFHIRNA